MNVEVYLIGKSYLLNIRTRLRYTTNNVLVLETSSSLFKKIIGTSSFPRYCMWTSRVTSCSEWDDYRRIWGIKGPTYVFSVNIYWMLYSLSLISLSDIRKDDLILFKKYHKKLMKCYRRKSIGKDRENRLIIIKEERTNVIKWWIPP